MKICTPDASILLSSNFNMNCFLENALNKPRSVSISDSSELWRVVHPTHMLPHDLLPGARSVVSFFLPFAPWVLEANTRHREQVAREWAVGEEFHHPGLADICGKCAIGPCSFEPAV